MSQATEGTSALTAVDRDGPTPRSGARLVFFHGPMDCGKSTLALQINHNHARQGRRGLVLTQLDRSGAARISSRTGMTAGAIEICPQDDLRELVSSRWQLGEAVDYVIVDEAQFLTARQVDELAELVDEVDIDCYCFGLATDFRTELFAGSKRLFELADEIMRLQVEVLCWCGRLASMNGRLVGGRLVREGEQVMVADTTAQPDDVHYQVLCRRHWRSGETGPHRPRQDPLPLE